MTPDGPQSILQLFAVLLLIAGPLPLVLVAVRNWGSAGHDALENLLATIVLTTASQLGVGLLLGFAGTLDTVPLLVAAVGLLAVGLLAGRRHGFARIVPVAPWPVARAASLLVVLIIGGLGAADLVVKPTQNFDSLAYHLPVMARWVESARLEAFTALGQVALYPGHYELLSTLLVLPPGQDLLVSLPNLLAWVQLGLALALVARRLGASDDAAALGAALVLATPSVLSRLDAVQPDILLAATFLTLFGFGLRPSAAGRRLDLAVLLLAAGILMGLKLSGPLYLLLVLPALLLGPQQSIRGVARRLRELDPRGAGIGLRFLVPVAAVAAGIGLAWYLRNWIVLGNPFGDLQIRLAGQTLFEGSVGAEELRRGSLAATFRPGSAADWAVLGRVLWSWLGAGVAALALGALLLPARRAAGGHRAQLLALLLFVCCVAVYWRTPYGGDNGTHGWRVTPWIEVGIRYGFCALGLLGALGAAGLSRPVWLVRAGLLVLVVTAVRTMLDELILNAAVLVVVVVAAWLFSVAVWRGRLATRMTGAAALGLLILVGVGLQLARSEREERRRLHFGEIVEVLATELDADDVVGVVNSQKLHLAAGRDWRRRVELPPLPAPGAEREWLAGLRRDGITALLVGHQEPDPEEAAAVGRVQRFLRESTAVELVADYESQAKDLALFRLRPAQSKR